MAIKFNIFNIAQFFTFLSPIIISSFLLLQSAMNFDLKAIFWLIGSCVAWFIGMLVKSGFHAMDDSKVAKAGAAGNLKPGLRTFQRTPVNHDWPMHPGTTRNNTPDYCSVFEGPWYNNTIQNTSMPSLNAVFHFYTILYILLGVAENPNKPIGGIITSIVLIVNALINLAFRKMLHCDKWMDIGLGVILGGLIGTCWYFAVYNMSNPKGTWTYYGIDDDRKRCKLGKMKFRCTYV